MLNRVPDRMTAITLVLALTVLGFLAVAVRSGPLGLDAADPGLLALRRAGFAGGLLDAVDLVGSLPVWGATVALLALLVARTGFRRSAELVGVAVVSEVAATAVKAVVGRARPPGADVGDLLIAAGFPSGHVTRTAVLVGVLLVLVPWTTRRPRLVLAAGLAAVALMGFARVSSGWHYTSDVLGACLLAAAILAGWHAWRASRRTAAGASLSLARTAARQGFLAIPVVVSGLFLAAVPSVVRGASQSPAANRAATRGAAAEARASSAIRRLRSSSCSPSASSRRSRRTSTSVSRADRNADNSNTDACNT